MLADSTFDGDVEFLKLATRQSNIDLTTAALEIARDRFPDLDFGVTFDWIEQRAREVRSTVVHATSAAEALQHLVDCLAQGHRVHGDSTCYERPESSYLNRVVETTRGIPITLSLLYMAVGARVGLSLDGVSAPMHFLSRVDSDHGPLFLDAFSHGRIMTESECVDWLQDVTQLSNVAIRSSLRPARPRDIVFRMLNNLKVLFTRQEAWSDAWRVQQRLIALHPDDWQQRRDLALIAIRRQKPGTAMELLGQCVRQCSADERPFVEAQVRLAEQELSRWN